MKRTVVTFKSQAFNTREPKDDFINPDNYGDDLARWLMQELRNRGLELDSDLGQEDFGWHFTFQVGRDQFDFVVSYREDEEANWIGRLERSVGFLPSLLGARKRHIAPDAIRAIHTVMTASPLIENLHWHLDSDFAAGREDMGNAEPFLIMMDGT